MPSLPMIAVRYLAWMVGLRILYVGLTMMTSFPNTLATVVILAAAPAIEIAMYAKRTARAPIEFGGWAKIWAVMFGVYVVVNVGLPAALVATTRAAVLDGSGLGSLAIVTASTGAMLALFLWVGTRAGRSG